MSDPESHPSIVDDEQISLSDDGELSNLASETTSTGNPRFRSYHETIGPVQNVRLGVICLLCLLVAGVAYVLYGWQMQSRSVVPCCIGLVAIPVLAILIPLGLWWSVYEDNTEEALPTQQAGPGDEGCTKKKQ